MAFVANTLPRRRFLQLAGKACAAAALTGLSACRQRSMMGHLPVGGLTPVPAGHWTELGDGSVGCELCPERCALAPGERGACLSRFNEQGGLVTVCGPYSYQLHQQPLEELPVLFSAATERDVLHHVTAGCNLDCAFCITAQPARTPPEDLDLYELSPAQVVREATAGGQEVMHFTDNEPLIGIERLVRIGDVARSEGLITTVATNGYFEPGPVLELMDHIDQVNFGLKGFSEDFYKRHCRARLAPILDCMKAAGHRLPQLSISYVVIPGAGDRTPWGSMKADNQR